MVIVSLLTHVLACSKHKFSLLVVNINLICICFYVSTMYAIIVYMVET